MHKILFAALPLALAFGAASAEPMQSIEARQAYFKALGGSMKAMGPLAKSFDAEAAKAEAAKLEAVLATDTSTFFPAGTSDADFPGKTRAMAKIWTDMDDFAAKGKATKEAGVELIAAANAGDGAAFGAAFGKLGGTCKACHDDYRLPE